MIFDDIVFKQLGYTIVGIWLLFGPVIGYLLSLLDIHLIIIIFLAGSWEIVDAFIFFYIHYVFNIEPKIVS